MASPISVFWGTLNSDKNGVDNHMYTKRRSTAVTSVGMSEWASFVVKVRQWKKKKKSRRGTLVFLRVSPNILHLPSLKRKGMHHKKFCNLFVPRKWEKLLSECSFTNGRNNANPGEFGGPNEQHCFFPSIKKKGGRGGGAIGNREYATPSTPFQFKKIAKGKKNDGTFGGCAT